ncbi:hypothetical protein CI238_07604, partial [Colletotrichum incanum]
LYDTVCNYRTNRPTHIRRIFLYTEALGQLLSTPYIKAILPQDGFRVAYGHLRNHEVFGKTTPWLAARTGYRRMSIDRASGVRITWSISMPQNTSMLWARQACLDVSVRLPLSRSHWLIIVMSSLAGSPKCIMWHIYG